MMVGLVRDPLCSQAFGGLSLYNASVASTARTDEMIKEAFGFLVEELDFELMDSHAGQRESSVTFCSPLVRVIAHVDHLPLGVHVGWGCSRRRDSAC